MRGSEFVALRVQLEDELKAWALATHTVERLRARGIYESPREGLAAESKRRATQRAGQLEGELAAVDQHLEGVSEYLQNGYVLLPRHVCSQGNALYRARPTGAGELRVGRVCLRTRASRPTRRITRSVPLTGPPPRPGPHLNPTLTKQALRRHGAAGQRSPRAHPS